MKGGGMKNARYALSICTGIIMGAIIALVVGNTITAVLSGVITAGVTAWIRSLQWEKAKEVASDVVGWLGCSSCTATRGTLKVAQKTPHAIGATTCFLYSITRRVVVALTTDIKIQKVVMGLLMIPVLLVPVAYLLSSLWLVDMVVKKGMIVVMLACIIYLAVFVIALALTAVVIDSYNDSAVFLGDWLEQMVFDDEHGVFMATARMLYFRTGNALKILAFPFILIPWLFVALANNKTGASALAAMALSGVHLTVAHFAGGINTDNANFWLSLSVALSLGAVVGRKVQRMSGEWRYPFPSITFRQQG